jgi:hypothetical protein
MLINNFNNFDINCMVILEGLIEKITDRSYSGRIYPQSVFDREYHLKIRKMRASRRRSRIIKLFIQ